MPNKPRADNPARPIRVENPLWAEVQAIAAEDETDASKVTRDAIKHYVKYRKRKAAQTAGPLPVTDDVSVA